MRHSRGFTLIELLVVIAIIGILSSIVLASLNTARLKSRDARRVADVKQLQLALALYFDSTGAYPKKLSLLAPTYIPTVPTDPTSNGNYTYAAEALSLTPLVCVTYHLGAVLEDKGNQALLNDSDTNPGGAYLSGNTLCGGSQAEFDGTSVGSSGICTATGGQAQPNGTELCYDVTP